MTIPPQPPLFSSPNFSQFSTQKSKTLLLPTMNDPKTQFSHALDHNYEHPFGQIHARLSQTNGICSSNCSDQDFVQFRPNCQRQEFMDSDDSGVCSPPLWKTSPSPSQPLLGNHHVYRNLSPDSRLHAITRGQRELMEMVKTMPESSYELSLKDMVEHHNVEAKTPPSNHRNLQQRGAGKVKRQESKKNDKNLMRIESKGLFLKMVVPFSLKSKKKKNYVNNSSGKVSPKPEVVKGGGERDWWKKKFTGSSDSDSSRTSNNSGSTVSSGGSSSGRSDGGSGGGKRKWMSGGCWPFFQSRSSKSAE